MLERSTPQILVWRRAPVLKPLSSILGLRYRWGAFCLRGMWRRKEQGVLWHDDPANDIDNQPGSGRPDRKDKKENSHEGHINSDIPRNPRANTGYFLVVPRTAQKPCGFPGIGRKAGPTRRCAALRTIPKIVSDFNSTRTAVHKCASTYDTPFRSQRFRSRDETKIPPSASKGRRRALFRQIQQTLVNSKSNI